MQGRKVDEILQLLKKELDYTYIKDENVFSAVIQSLKKKVEELNNKYPKTIKYYVRVENGINDDEQGYIRIDQSGFTMKGICVPYYNVREYKEGGEL